MKWNNVILIGFLVFCFSASLQAQDRIEVKKIDGIPHILNPAKPLKGTVQLEAEKVLTINEMREYIIILFCLLVILLNVSPQIYCFQLN
jgi:hypothetical protein